MRELGLVEFWTARDEWPDCAEEVPYDFRAECARVERVPKDDLELRLGAR